MANYPQYQIKSSSGQYYFVLKSTNGETILTSERYVTKQGCQSGIASVKSHAPFDRYYNRLTSSNGQPYFTLRAANNEVIGTSELYSSTYNRENGIAACKRDAPVAGTVDLTMASV